MPMSSHYTYQELRDTILDLLEEVDNNWNTVGSTRNLLSCERAPDDEPGDGFTIHFEDGGSIRVTVEYDTTGRFI